MDFNHKQQAMILFVEIIPADYPSSIGQFLPIARVFC